MECDDTHTGIQNATESDGQKTMVESDSTSYRVGTLDLIQEDILNSASGITETHSMECVDETQRTSPDPDLSTEDTQSEIR